MIDDKANVKFIIFFEGMDAGHSPNLKTVFYLDKINEIHVHLKIRFD